MSKYKISLESGNVNEAGENPKMRMALPELEKRLGESADPKITTSTSTLEPDGLATLFGEDPKPQNPETPKTQKPETLKP